MKKVILLMQLKLRKLPGFLQLITLALAIFLSSPLLAQTVVKGKVTDESGTAMPGVNIIVKNTTAGTTTDSNGAYSLSVEDNSAVLVFSFIGYATTEQSLNGRSTIDVSLEPSAEQLSEIVVVGYGVQQKRDVTGAIVSVSAETLREVGGQPNFVNQLKGRVAGLDIISNGSTPGSGGQIRIRGNRSLNTDVNQLNALDAPLLVLDGIPYGGSINDINPDDISSLEVLKDASATAIYGSRGSGGVILITTKRGTKTGKPTLNYEAYYGSNKIMGKLDVFNGPEYAAYKAESAAGNSNAPNTTTYPLTAAENAALAAGISTDWQDLIYQTGNITNHYLTATGGNENSQFSLGGGYYQETGIIPNQDFSRFTGRATIDTKLNDRIRVGLNTINTLAINNTPGGGGVPMGLMKLTPLADPYNADGTINLFPNAGQTDGGFISPLTLMTKSDAILNRSRRLRTFNSLYGEVQIIEGLKYRINVGLDYRQELQDSYNGPLTYTNSAQSSAQANASIRNMAASTYTIENLLMFDRTFGKHKIGATALYSAQKDVSQNTGMFAVGMPADYVQNYNFGLATTVTPINPGNANDNPNNFSERGLLSYMGRATYNYDGRYSITATMRRDGSSVLSPGNQWFTYPAFAAAWNLSNESFMSGISAISSLKLRAGWGKTSNQGINPYSTLGALGANYYNFGNTAAGQQNAFLVTQLPNNSLHWQSTSQSNVGIDFGLFNNRITGSLEYYAHNTKDILLSVLLPASNGAGSTIQNLGKTKGKGLELTVTTVNMKTASGLTWSTDWIYFFNREEITQLTTPEEKENIANGWFVGHPMTVIYDVKKIGIWQLTDDAERLAQTVPVQLPGQVRVEDINGRDAGNALTGVPDGRITADDRQILGNFQPKWEGSLTNRVSFKNFDLTAVIYARMGMKVVVPYVASDGSAAGYTFFGQGRNNQLQVDYWTPSNPTNNFPRPDAYTDRPLFASTLMYMDGSFVKFRTISLGYTFPKDLLSKARVQSLRIYVSAVNPFVLYSPFVKDGFGPDPEGNGYGGAVGSQAAALGAGQSAPNRLVTVNANNPSTRQFSAGLNLRF